MLCSVLCELERREKEKRCERLVVEAIRFNEVRVELMTFRHADDLLPQTGTAVSRLEKSTSSVDELQFEEVCMNTDPSRHICSPPTAFWLDSADSSFQSCCTVTCLMVVVTSHSLSSGEQSHIHGHICSS